MSVIEEILGQYEDIATNDANGLCYSPSFGAVSSTDSNKYRERQVQFAIRFHF